jgi:hypothetical protein
MQSPQQCVVPLPKPALGVHHAPYRFFLKPASFCPCPKRLGWGAKVLVLARVRMNLCQVGRVEEAGRGCSGMRFAGFASRAVQKRKGLVGVWTMTASLAGCMYPLYPAAESRGFPSPQHRVSDSQLTQPSQLLPWQSSSRILSKEQLSFAAQ